MYLNINEISKYTKHEKTKMHCRSLKMGKGAQREGLKSPLDEKMEERFAKIIEVSFFIISSTQAHCKDHRGFIFDRINSNALITISRLGKNHRTYELQANRLPGWIRRWTHKQT